MYIVFDSMHDDNTGKVFKRALFKNRKNFILDWSKVFKDSASGFEFYHVPNFDSDDISKSFLGNCELMLKYIQQDIGDAIVPDLHGNDCVIRYVDRAYGSTVRKDTLALYENVTFTHAVAFSLAGSCVEQPIVCTDGIRHLQYPEGYDALTFETKSEADTYIKSIQEKANDMFMFYDALSGERQAEFLATNCKNTDIVFDLFSAMYNRRNYTLSVIKLMLPKFEPYNIAKHGVLSDIHICADTPVVAMVTSESGVVWNVSWESDDIRNDFMLGIDSSTKFIDDRPIDSKLKHTNVFSRG